MTTPYEEMHKWQLLDRIEDLEAAIAKYRHFARMPIEDYEHNVWENESAFDAAEEHLFSLVPEDVSR